jgi:hypothetical protein
MLTSSSSLASSLSEYSTVFGTPARSSLSVGVTLGGAGAVGCCAGAEISLTVLLLDRDDDPEDDESSRLASGGMEYEPFDALLASSF